ncbi:MAG: hypothetical protein IT427_09465 [Pirellulales bacterium]|nr:hypothetical protein [Pirellulales bacterium]
MTMHRSSSLIKFDIWRSAYIIFFSLAWLLGNRDVGACPFCVAVNPTLVQQRESANKAFLGECLAVPTSEKPGEHQFSVFREFTGKFLAGGQTKVVITLDQPIQAGTLALVLAEPDSATSANNRWHCLPLNEIEFAYIAAAPDLRTIATKRVEYFAPRLEHADPLIAEDAFGELGHAPFEAVEQAAFAFNAKKLRQWIVDPGVPNQRKGFYGLALGITAQGEARAINLALLDQLINTDSRPGDDLRAGFDGLIGGYLVARGREGIELIAKRYLTNPDASIGDVRQVHKALRFDYEFGPSEHRKEVVAAIENLLNRPSDAAAAITDLARWQEWSELERIVTLFDHQDFAGSDIRLAIVGYLRSCPLPKAETALVELRRREPKPIAAAEAALEALSGN